MEWPGSRKAAGVVVAIFALIAIFVSFRNKTSGDPQVKDQPPAHYVPPHAGAKAKAPKVLREPSPATKQPVLSYSLIENRSDFTLYNKLVYAVEVDGSPINEQTLTELLNSIYDKEIGSLEHEKQWTMILWAYTDRKQYYDADDNRAVAMLEASSTQAKTITFPRGQF